MKQLIEISVKDAFELINFLKQNQKNDLSEKIFEKTTSSDDFNEYLQIELGSSAENHKKAKEGVINILSLASGYPKSQITPEKTLKLDLKISPNIINRLHRPFNKLLKELQSKKTIKSNEVATCEKVKDCEDLIIKKL